MSGLARLSTGTSPARSSPSYSHSRPVSPLLHRPIEFTGIRCARLASAACLGGSTIPRRRDDLYARSVLIRSELHGFTDAQARSALAGLPRAGDYEVVVKPLRYRSSPHLAARCEFEDRRIVLQVPIPFRPFKEPVVYAARRKRGNGIRFAWASETVSFRLRREVLRFLYCHEWMHWYLFEELGKRSE